MDPAWLPAEWGTGREPPLRIALFCEQGAPGSSFQSGVSRLADQIVQACLRTGSTLDFYTYDRVARADVDRTVTVLRLVPRAPLNFHGLIVDGADVVPLMNPHLRAAARGRVYDVVVATSPGIGTQGQLLARRMRAPFVAFHTTDLPHYARSLVAASGIPGAPTVSRRARAAVWHYLSWYYAPRRTARVYVPTRAARTDLLAMLDATVEVLGRGADTIAFPSVERPPRCPARLLYVGRVDYGQKNLRVLEEVIRAVPGTTLRVVGGGDDLALMRARLATEIADGRVVLTGQTRGVAELREVYLEADIFVFPSIYDTLGQVVLEAQAAGLPVVVRDRGGPAELVEAGRTGLVAADDAEFVAHVESLVRNPARREAMGEAARLHAAAMPAWRDVMDDLLARLSALSLRPGSARSATPSRAPGQSARHPPGTHPAPSAPAGPR